MNPCANNNFMQYPVGPDLYSPNADDEMKQKVAEMSIADRLALYKASQPGPDPLQRHIREIFMKIDLPMAAQKYKIPGMKQHFLEGLREEIRQTTKKVVYIEGPNPEQPSPGNPIRDPALTAVGVIMREMCHVGRKDIALCNMDLCTCLLSEALRPLIKCHPTLRVLLQNVRLINESFCCRSVPNEEISFDGRCPREVLNKYFQ